MSKIFDALVKHESDLAQFAKDFAAANTIKPLTNGAAAKFAVAHDPVITSIRQEAHEAPQIRVAPLHLSVTTPLFPFDQHNAQAAEQYRIVRTKILQDLRQPRVILVSSASPMDGKTITAINLSGVMALRKELRVLLVEADLHRSNIAKILGLPDGPGLAEVITGKAEIARALVRIEQFPNLYVLPGGGPYKGATELLDSHQWRAVVENLGAQFTHVIIDSPPVGVLADFDLLKAVADGVVFVVRPDQTNRTLCLKALSSVPEDKLLGVVLNAAKDWSLHRSGNSYYYNYYYNNTPANKV